MRKFVLFLIGIAIFASCKNETKESAQEEATADINIDDKIGKKQLKGEFIYYADAAVLQTPTEVYGVIIDSMMHVLNEKVKIHKKESTDMVPVAIMGNVTPKAEDEEGWPYKVKVLQVLKVYKPEPNSNDVIKLEK